MYIPTLWAIGKFRAEIPQRAGLRRRESWERLNPVGAPLRVGSGRQRCGPVHLGDGDGLRVPWGRLVRAR